MTTTYASTKDRLDQANLLLAPTKPLLQGQFIPTCAPDGHFPSADGLAPSWWDETVTGAFGALKGLWNFVEELSGLAPDSLDPAKVMGAYQEAKVTLQRIDRFLKDLDFPIAPVISRGEAYLGLESQAKANSDAVGRGRTSLAGSWEGPASTAALGHVDAWKETLEGARGLYLGMHHAVRWAGEAFRDARNAALPYVQPCYNRIRAAKPSVGLSVGIGLAIPGAGAGSYALQLVHYAFTVRDEMYQLLIDATAAANEHTAKGSWHLGELSRHRTTARRVISLLDTGRDDYRPTQQDQFLKQNTGSGHRKIDDECLQIIAHEKGRDELPPGYHELTDDEMRARGLHPELYRDEETGFESHVYEYTDPATGESHLVVTFGDTNDTADIYEDASGGIAYSRQTAQTDAVVRDLQQSEGTKEQRESGTYGRAADHTVFAGYSLGGRHATTASAMTGNPAVTFNAAGANDPQLAYYAGEQNRPVEDVRSDLDGRNIRHYHTEEDLLTRAQTSAQKDGAAIHPGSGQTTTLDDGGHSDYHRGSIGAATEAHLPDELIEDYNRTHGTTIKHGETNSPDPRVAPDGRPKHGRGRVMH